jgi:hypothetical protein
VFVKNCSACQYGNGLAEPRSAFACRNIHEQTLTLAPRVTKRRRPTWGSAHRLWAGGA